MYFFWQFHGYLSDSRGNYTLRKRMHRRNANSFSNPRTFKWKWKWFGRRAAIQSLHGITELFAQASGETQTLRCASICEKIDNMQDCEN